MNNLNQINKLVMRFPQRQLEIVFQCRKGKSKKRKSKISMFPKERTPKLRRSEGKTRGWF